MKFLSSRCRWCNERLEPARLALRDLLWLFLLIRPCRCPHCMERQYRVFWVVPFAEP